MFWLPGATVSVSTTRSESPVGVIVTVTPPGGGLGALSHSLTCQVAVEPSVTDTLSADTRSQFAVSVSRALTAARSMPL